MRNVPRYRKRTAQHMCVPSKPAFKALPPTPGQPGTASVRAASRAAGLKGPAVMELEVAWQWGGDDSATWRHPNSSRDPPACTLRVPSACPLGASSRGGGRDGARPAGRCSGVPFCHYGAAVRHSGRAVGGSWRAGAQPEGEAGRTLAATPRRRQVTQRSCPQRSTAQHSTTRSSGLPRSMRSTACLRDALRLAPVTRPLVQRGVAHARQVGQDVPQQYLRYRQTPCSCVAQPEARTGVCSGDPASAAGSSVHRTLCRAKAERWRSTGRGAQAAERCP